MGERRHRKPRKEVLSDLAVVTGVGLKLFVVPGVFRALAEEAMLAEGRAFERCVCHTWGSTIALKAKFKYLQNENNQVVYLYRSV